MKLSGHYCEVCGEQAEVTVADAIEGDPAPMRGTFIRTVTYGATHYFCLSHTRDRTITPRFKSPKEELEWMLAHPKLDKDQRESIKLELDWMKSEGLTFPGPAASAAM